MAIPCKRPDQNAATTLPAVASAASPTYNEGDAVPLSVGLDGTLRSSLSANTPNDPSTNNFTSAGDNIAIAAPGAATRLYVCKGSVHNRHASNVTVSLRDGLAGTVYWRAELAAEGGGSLFDFGARGWRLTVNTALYVNLSGASDIDLNVTEYYTA